MVRLEGRARRRASAAVGGVGHGVIPEAIWQATRTNGVAGPDGAHKAIRSVYAGGLGSSVDRVLERTLANGSYVVQWDMKSNTGGSCSIRVGEYPFGSGDKTATPSWQTFQHAITIPADGQTKFAFSITRDTADAAHDIAIDNIAFLPTGAEEAAEPGLCEHLHVTPQAAALNMAGDVIEGTSSLRAGCRVTFGAEEVARDAFSFVAAVRMDPDAADTGAQVYPLLAELEAPGDNNLNNPLGLFFGLYASEFIVPGLSTPWAGPQKSGWRVVGVTAGADGMDLWIDGIKVVETGNAWAGATLRAAELMGMRDNLGSSFPGKMAASYLWWRRLEAAEMAAATAAAIVQIGAAGETFVPIDTVLVANGDSITAFNGALGGYVGRAGRLIAPRLQAANFAVAGSIITGDGASLGTLNLNNAARLAEVDAKVAEITATGRCVIYSVLIGANMSPIVPADLYAVLHDHMEACRAISPSLVRTLVCTITDQESDPTGASGYTDAERADAAAFNALLLAGAGTDFDAVADLNAAIGLWSGTNFGDFVHPNATGYALMAPTFADALEGLVA